MEKVTFVALEGTFERDGSNGWAVEVNGERIIDRIGSGDTDIADSSLNPLWEKLGITVDFDWD